MSGNNREESKQLRIVFFGDSICVGQGVSIHKGWVTRLSQLVSSIGERERRDIVIVNASVNGNTTRMALERMPYDVQSHGVDLLILQFGMNDCNYWLTDRGVPRVSVRAFEANLDEIIERATRFGARQIVLNTNHPTTRDAEEMPFAGCTYEASNRAYNRVIRRVARRHPGLVVLNDVERHCARLVASGACTLDELLLPDRLHLSERGHDAYFQITAPLVEKLVHALVTAPTRAGRAPKQASKPGRAARSR